tara:strand:- start:1383 stop:1625 length:243 start_codon:yes stop_codon:yes gene_type:complete
MFKSNVLKLNEDRCILKIIEGDNELAIVEISDDESSYCFVAVSMADPEYQITLSENHVDTIKEALHEMADFLKAEYEGAG